MSETVSNENLRDLIRELQREMKETRQTLIDKLEDSQKKVTELEEENKYLRSRVDFLGARGRENNLIVNGLQVDVKENLEDYVIGSLNEKLDLRLSTSESNNVYIVGSKPNGPTKLKLASYLKQSTVPRSAHRLKEHRYLLTMIYLEQSRKKIKFQDHLKKVRIAGHTEQMRGKKLCQERPRRVCSFSRKSTVIRLVQIGGKETLSYRTGTVPVTPTTLNSPSDKKDSEKVFHDTAAKENREKNQWVAREHRMRTGGC
ncbi:hypothetical protein HHI36_001503 [Cryptolaemus montrouzieri]|uniref:Uncharacterized protein n=1 Tax=Cryptolaemus montrouzieri TaxID=559131 RepID=A0ABD2P7N4_9CUCU